MAYNRRIFRSGPGNAIKKPVVVRERNASDMFRYSVLCATDKNLPAIDTQTIPIMMTWGIPRYQRSETGFMPVTKRSALQKESPATMNGNRLSSTGSGLRDIAMKYARKKNKCGEYLEEKSR